MHLPDTRPRAAYGWVKELWQGAASTRRLHAVGVVVRMTRAARCAGYKLPCGDAQRGGTDCAWDGTSGGNAAARGVLTPATPPDFHDWMLLHTGTLHSDMARAAPPRLHAASDSGASADARVRAQLRCGWSFRGIFAASAGAIRKHSPAFYANLEDQLGAAVFPVAGMYMERLWRRVLLCARPDAGLLPAGAQKSRGGRDGAGVEEVHARALLRKLPP